MHSLLATDAILKSVKYDAFDDVAFRTDIFKDFRWNELSIVFEIIQLNKTECCMWNKYTHICKSLSKLSSSPCDIFYFLVSPYSSFSFFCRLYSSTSFVIWREWKKVVVEWMSSHLQEMMSMLLKQESSLMKMGTFIFVLLYPNASAYKIINSKYSPSTAQILRFSHIVAHFVYVCTLQMQILHLKRDIFGNEDAFRRTTFVMIITIMTCFAILHHSK